jgi:hypothetical protein
MKFKNHKILRAWPFEKIKLLLVFVDNLSNFWDLKLKLGVFKTFVSYSIIPLRTVYSKEIKIVLTINVKHLTSNFVDLKLISS